MPINFLVAFTSGVVSFAAPCVVPLLPAYIGYVTGVGLKDLREKGLVGYRRQVVISSLAYVVGFALVFVMLGAAAGGFGAVLRVYDVWIQRMGGILIMAWAFQFMGVVKIPGLAMGRGWQLPAWAQHLGYGRALVLGIVFAITWTPCVGAVLGAILTLAAASQTVTIGATMLGLYALGIAVPFVALSLTLAQAPGVIKIIERYSGLMSRVAGVMLLIIGFLVFNNTVGLISEDLTYNKLNSILFEIAFRLGYQIR
jgi:cytochrome c-type biogenesis protein